MYDLDEKSFNVIKVIKSINETLQENQNYTMTLAKFEKDVVFFLNLYVVLNFFFSMIHHLIRR